jgi:hypothetical protein
MKKSGSALIQSADGSIIQVAEGRLDYGGSFNGISRGYSAHDLHCIELPDVPRLGEMNRAYKGLYLDNRLNSLSEHDSPCAEVGHANLADLRCSRCYNGA